MGSGVKSAVGTLGGPIGGVVTGKGLFGGLRDTVLGKKDPGQAAQNIDLRTEQEKALQEQLVGQYGQIANQDVSKLAAQTTMNQENVARQSAQDQQMRAQQNIAQRGLSGTSTGLSALQAPSRQLAQQLGTIQGQAPLLQEQLRQQNLNTAAQGLSGLMAARSGSQIYQPAVASRGRQGGLAPLLGGAVGAYFGGPAGAQIGMGLGQAATQV